MKRIYWVNGEKGEEKQWPSRISLSILFSNAHVYLFLVNISRIFPSLFVFSLSGINVADNGEPREVSSTWVLQAHFSFFYLSAAQFFFLFFSSQLPLFVITNNDNNNKYFLLPFLKNIKLFRSSQILSVIFFFLIRGRKKEETGSVVQGDNKVFNHPKNIS